MGSAASWRKSSYSVSNGECAEIADDWRKSSRSAAENCIETADQAGVMIAVRDSKDPGGTVLAFSPDVFRAFITRVKAS